MCISPVHKVTTPMSTGRVCVCMLVYVRGRRKSLMGDLAEAQALGVDGGESSQTHGGIRRVSQWMVARQR